MSEKCVASVKINQDYCSRCSICHSVCPYEAIRREAETGKVEVDIEKCQVCGICYSACPVMAIEISYYDYDSLVRYVEDARQRCNSDTLVLMCRGNSPSTCKIEEILSSQGLNVDGYIPLRLPCSGRVPTEFIFKVLKSGVRNVVSVQCEDEFCRFKEGTKTNTRRLLLGDSVLKQLGFENAVKVVKYSRKAVYETEKCVGCDKCVFICPYEAIEAEPFATPKILGDRCVGCGACALVCPHHAIQVEGFEFEKTMNAYLESARRLKQQRKPPLVLVFCCQWSEFSALDNSANLLKGKAVTLEIPCFKALDPVHVVKALQDGFDGVLAVVCSAEDCKLQEGRETTERNMAVLSEALKKMGLSERFELFEASPRCEGRFSQKLDEFTRKISAMPILQTAKTEARADV